MKLRRRKKRPADELEDARDRLNGFLEHGKAPPRRRGEGRGRGKLKPVEVALDDARHRARSGDWTDAGGRSFVGLYALCFRIVYGEIPVDLFTKSEFGKGSRLATKSLHEWFDDDPDALVAFVKWTWEREKGKNTWALGQGIERRPMSVGLQFSAAMVRDFRASRHVRGRGRRGR